MSSSRAAHVRRRLATIVTVVLAVVLVPATRASAEEGERFVITNYDLSGVEDYAALVDATCGADLELHEAKRPSYIARTGPGTVPEGERSWQVSTTGTDDVATGMWLRSDTISTPVTRMPFYAEEDLTGVSWVVYLPRRRPQRFRGLADLDRSRGPGDAGRRGMAGGRRLRPELHLAPVRRQPVPHRSDLHGHPSQDPRQVRGRHCRHDGGPRV